MPSIEDNKRVWGEAYEWPEAGDEWSTAWGSAEAQWVKSVWPRIKAYLPAAHILEIAPGFGRWTQFLEKHAEKVTLVDLSEKCIQSCRSKFGGDPRFKFVVNDGKSLPAIENNSIDLVFSFDALVHAEMDAIEGYLHELNRVLTQDGVAFLHHSNSKQYAQYFSRVYSLPQGRIRSGLRTLGIIEDRTHWRGTSVNADTVFEAAGRCGLHIIRQETVNWYTHPRFQIDCFSTIVRSGSKWDQETERICNKRFMDEAKAQL